jgi:hypothetical protein
MVLMPGTTGTAVAHAAKPRSTASASRIVWRDMVGTNRALFFPGNFLQPQKQKLDTSELTLAEWSKKLPFPLRACLFLSRVGVCLCPDSHI